MQVVFSTPDKYTLKSPLYKQKGVQYPHLFEIELEDVWHFYVISDKIFKRFVN